MTAENSRLVGNSPLAAARGNRFVTPRERPLRDGASSRGPRHSPLFQ